MRISGTDFSSVILCQTKQFKTLISDGPKVSKQSEAKRDGVINEWTFRSLFPKLSCVVKLDIYTWNDIFQSLSTAAVFTKKFKWINKSDLYEKWSNSFINITNPFSNKCKSFNNIFHSIY